MDPMGLEHGDLFDWILFSPTGSVTLNSDTYLVGSFKDFFYIHPYLGKIPSLTNIFQRGWNRQLDIFRKKCTNKNPYLEWYNGTVDGSEVRQKNLGCIKP